MQRYKILWVDDEIDLLKPYVLTLEEKNFQINTFNNPYSILEYIDENNDFDLILLDENMPGKSGLTLIKDIKDRKPFVPIIMITKNEEENIMNEAIGSMISDYLIKPLNPGKLIDVTEMAKGGFMDEEIEKRMMGGYMEYKEDK